jgi:hypothetical protein
MIAALLIAAWSFIALHLRKWSWTKTIINRFTRRRQGRSKRMERSDGFFLLPNQRPDKITKTEKNKRLPH